MRAGLLVFVLLGHRVRDHQHAPPRHPLRLKRRRPRPEWLLQPSLLQPAQRAATATAAASAQRAGEIEASRRRHRPVSTRGLGGWRLKMWVAALAAVPALSGAILPPSVKMIAVVRPDDWPSGFGCCAEVYLHSLLRVSLGRHSSAGVPMRSPRGPCFGSVPGSRAPRPHSKGPVLRSQHKPVFESFALPP